MASTMKEPPRRRPPARPRTAPSPTAPVTAPDRRVYVLDTSVLLADPAALARFAEHEVVIPLVVLSELETTTGAGSQRNQFVEIATGVSAALDLSDYAVVIIDGADDAVHDAPVGAVLGTTTTLGRYTIGGSKTSGVQARIANDAFVTTTNAAAIVLIRGSSLPPITGTLAEAPCATAELTVRTGATTWFDRAHYLSAAAVSFARGANDTPKMAALLVATGLSASAATLAVALAIAIGGWFGTRRVAQTMARDITRIEPADGFGANLVTALLVTVASRFGLPVSTTHVSCGSLFGLALVQRRGDGSTVRRILLAWVVTLPIAALLAFLIRGAWPA